jgi:hypothetical protein
MNGYRIFLTPGGRIRSPSIEFDASSDVVAIRHAEEVRRGAAAELWCRGRRVATFQVATPVRVNG